MNLPDSSVAVTTIPPLIETNLLAQLLGATLPLASPLDVQMTMAAAAISKLIRGYCGRTITKGAYTGTVVRSRAIHGGALVDWNGSRRMFLVETPVEKVTGIVADGRAVPLDGLALHHALGRVDLPAVIWPQGATDVSIEYVGGYDPLPPDLALLFVDLVRRQLLSMGVSPTAFGAVTGTAPVREVTVGSLRVQYAVYAAESQKAVEESRSPLTSDSMSDFAHVLNQYRYHRTLMAVG
jgi:hypothetical protein